MGGNDVTNETARAGAEGAILDRLSDTVSVNPVRILVLAPPDSDVFELSLAPRPELFQVRKASDHPSALQILAEAQFDIILIDPSLPGNPGGEALREIRDAASPPAIVVSPRPIEEEPSGEGIRIGNTHYFLKGDESEALLISALIYHQGRILLANELAAYQRNLDRLQRELDATQLQLIQAEKLEALGQLAAGVAHEVKNPLARILLGVDYLTRTDLSNDGNVPEVLNSIRSAAKTADTIIRGMVDLSCMTKLLPKFDNLNEVVQGAALLVHHELTLHSIDLQLDLQSSLPLACIDAAKIEQVLLNLYLNAIHAMAESPIRHLRVSTATADITDDLGPEVQESALPELPPGTPLLLIRVEDEGTGLPAAADVFEPFFSTKEPGKGTGLGLSVCRRIIELHHGLLTLENRPQSGAVATIILPGGDAGLLSAD